MILKTNILDILKRLNTESILVEVRANIAIERSHFTITLFCFEAKLNENGTNVAKYRAQLRVENVFVWNFKRSNYKILLCCIVFVWNFKVIIKYYYIIIIKYYYYNYKILL